MARSGDHAVVLGASIAGLLAARVLADFYRTVTVVERDVLPDGPTSRRGVPQSRHAHALLGGGGKVMDALLPGLSGELIGAGGEILYYRDLDRIHASLGGHVIVRSGAARSSDAVIYLVSRQLLEARIRARVRALTNVVFLDNNDVVDLSVNPSRTRVSGVTVSERRSGSEIRWIPTDLVVDATGRGSRTPAFLKNIGYEPAPEQHVVTRTAYSSQLLAMPPTVVEPLVMVGALPDRPTGMYLSRYEDSRWIFTLYGMLGHEPPDNLPAMVRFVEDFAPPHVVSALRAAVPIGPAARHRMPSSQWRRYDKLRRFPDGLLVCGDAISSFNPIYGQGMTVAALDAVAMQNCLRHGTRHLARRYFGDAATSIGVAWGMAAGSDLNFPGVTGARTPLSRLTNRYVEWLLTASESDVMVAERFFRVNHFLEHPRRLLAPSIGVRVARANVRGHRRRMTAPAESAHGPADRLDRLVS